VLVLNNSKVIPARLRGVNARTGGEFEVLLLEQNAVNDWWAMMRPGKRARVDSKINLRDASGSATGISPPCWKQMKKAIGASGFHEQPMFSTNCRAWERFHCLPISKRSSVAEMADDWERYQTIYAQTRGSRGAPTAGLHFTSHLLEKVATLV